MYFLNIETSRMYFHWKKELTIDTKMIHAGNCVYMSY